MESEKRIIDYEDGSYAEIYHKKGGGIYHHREDGPAFVKYNLDGSIEYELYLINGRLISKEEWYEKYGWKLKLKGTPMEKIYCK